ncbi:MAG: hypothetical protein RIC80_13745 [Cyclobacteriaceae bacterium]
MQETRLFSPHLYEPIRIEIGLNIITRELWKTYPHKTYSDVRNAVNQHFGKLSSDKEIRHFWNQVNSFSMGLWQKNSIKPLTSAQYVWTKVDDMDTSDMIFDWDFNGRLPSKNQTVAALAKYIKEHLQIAENEMKLSNELILADPRRADRVIVAKTNRGLTILDGHGRLIHAIVHGRNQINAYLGEKIKSGTSNEWIPTEYLYRLFVDRSYFHLAYLLKSSQNARVEFAHYLSIGDLSRKRILRNLNLLAFVYSVLLLLNKALTRL